MEISKKVKRKFLTVLPDTLGKRYGFSKYYTWKQVRKTVVDLWPEWSEMVCYAYPLYCEKNVFEELSITCEIEHGYDEIRMEFGVPRDNSQPFWRKKSDSNRYILDSPNPDALITGGLS